MGITTSKATIDVEHQPTTLHNKKLKKKNKPCARATSRHKESDSANNNAKLPLSPWLQQRLRKISHPTPAEPTYPRKSQHTRAGGRKKHNVASISRKKNAKRKKVTKSIIGKPSNFQVRRYPGEREIQLLY